MVNVTLGSSTDPALRGGLRASGAGEDETCSHLGVGRKASWRKHSLHWRARRNQAAVLVDVPSGPSTCET